MTVAQTPAEHSILGLPAKTGVVLLHGLSSTPDELLSINGPLRQLGCSVVPLRIAGYSFDPQRPERRSRPFETWVQSVHDAVLELRKSHDRVVLVGISAGAGLALASSMHPQVAAVDGLVLMSTTLRYDGWAITPWHFLLPLAFYTPLGRWWQYKEQPPFGVKNERIRAWIKRELQTRRISLAGNATLGVTYLREHHRMIRHIKRHLGQVCSPDVLAIHAQEDDVASPANLEILTDGLSFKVKRLKSVIVFNSYHMVSIDNDRQIVVKETVSFVRSIMNAP
jgi:carboxylesterase